VGELGDWQPVVAQLEAHVARRAAPVAADSPVEVKV
jgi:hypothetical protein